ncbi:methyltransferase domain-containing protein [Xanthovirga aplysinae]|uniref:methyltransferase domain-containing protein n=1 Tax=Xanthovirga aplysinae TaxID=2529853 RepID=UPI001656A948|nr:methyltransferase domain-containing protein [Xanthovirga aplysinae]
MSLTGSFDAVSSFYDPLSRLVFGKALIRSQTCFLNLVPQYAHVLIIGGGTGWIIEELLSKKPSVFITYVEASVKMLEKSKERFSNSPFKDQITFILGTHLTIREEEKYQVVITNFFLDLFQQATLPSIMNPIYKALDKDGLWFFSDFSLRSKRTYSFLHKILVRIMYLFFGAFCKIEGNQLPNFDKAFQDFDLKEVAGLYFYTDLVQAKVFIKK